MHCKRLLLVFFALAVLGVRNQAYAQFTEAHHYDNTPVGVNQLELAYAYGRSDASLDTSLIVVGAKVNLNQGTVDYTRYFGFLHRLVWADASVPIAGLDGSVTGTKIRRSNIGTGDSSYELAALLKGVRRSALLNSQVTSRRQPLEQASPSAHPQANMIQTKFST